MVKVLRMPNIPFTMTIPTDTRPQAQALEPDFSCGSGDKREMAPPLKVSELVLMLKTDVEKKHRFVRVVGELSSFKQWRSGHCYFDVKDEETVLPAVMFRPFVARLPFSPKDGQQILFTGRISIYPANAKMQMVVEQMEPLGQGALALAFEQLKERLLKEGLFEAAHKKPIKAFNECVGLITSSHGAVLRDMVRILKTRMPKVNILFSPVRVQGVGAASEIKQAIELLDQTGACDVIIVGRGGGSLEDLWPFNEEMVARAIYNARTPIISAVGHETDFSMSDFVADVRAATPTHAATLVVPVHSDLVAELKNAQGKIHHLFRGHLKDGHIHLNQYKKRLKDPRIVLFKHWQQLDEQSRTLHDSMTLRLKAQGQALASMQAKLSHLAPHRSLRIKKESLFQARARLLAKNPKHVLARHRQEVSEYRAALTHRARNWQKLMGMKLFEQVVKLEALSPLKVLHRGYSVVHDERGSVLSKTADFRAGQTIFIRAVDGTVCAQVIETNKSQDKEKA